MTMDYPTTITAHASQDQASAHREDGNFVVWLLGMVRNAYKDHLPYQRHRSINELDRLMENTRTDFIVLPESAEAEKVWVRQEEIRVINTLIDQLPTYHRDVLLIVDVHRYTHAEAMQMLQLPLDTIKTHLCQARMALRDRLVAVGQVPGRPA